MAKRKPIGVDYLVSRLDKMALDRLQDDVTKAEFVEALDESHEKDVLEPVKPEPVPELTPLERDPGRM